METDRERKGIAALRAYVTGESSEPIVLSAFRDVEPEDLAVLVSRARPELEAIDGARLLILESMLLPLEHRTR